MYGEFEKDVINELRQANRTLQEILCYQAMIMSNLDEKKKEVKNEAKNNDKSTT